jgi:hydrogenase maturation protein HypF
MAAVLGEHGVTGPALGLIWDGTGAGLDGTAWGGELFVGDCRAVRRLATFRAIPLAGGSQAIREPWRLAIALLQDAFEGDAPVEALALFDRVPRDLRDQVAELIERPELCVAAHGVGRYFDGVGALLLRQPNATYQGEIAQGLNFLATGRPALPYPFVLDTLPTPWEIDLRPCIRALLEDLFAGHAPSRIADRFHATLAAAGEAAVRAGLRVAPEVVAGSPDGRARIVLAGGCFQNAILRDMLESRLGGDFAVLNPLDLPPGDGGLAFGQVVVADALASLPSAPPNGGA